MRTAVSENMERFDYQLSICDSLLRNRKCLLVLTDRVSESENLKEYKTTHYSILIN
jgi:hypothetical protein